MAEEDTEAQENELIALESIFEGDEVSLTCDTVSENGKDFKSGVFRIAPTIPNPPISFSCQFNPEGSDRNEGLISTNSISYLPPVELAFFLPPNYPSEKPPQFTLLCSWLDRVHLSSISKKLDEIWTEQEGQEVLYNWVQFLQEQTLGFLKLDDGINFTQDKYLERLKMEDFDPRVSQGSARFSDIFPSVIEYDEMRKKKVFQTTLFECQVCFTEKYGKHCIQFKECEHVYCSECIKSYFDLQIKEGNMKGLNCPDPGCESQAYPAQIKELVSLKDFERYETLLLQTTLDSMKDIMYCPRKFCQSAVVVEPEETIGICPACKYSFCPFCKFAYHGIEPCKLKKLAMQEVCEKYKNGDAKTRKELESKYGGKVLQQLIQNMESENWISTNSRNCPGCGAAIEKNDGCNKMTCYKCKCFFCWLCMGRLSLANPYDHYNKWNSKCYNKLFEGTTMEDLEFENLDFEDPWLY